MNILNSIFGSKPKSKGDWIVVSEGNSHHRHNFQEAKWDNSLGKDFEQVDESGYYARYKDLYECSCGARKVYSVVAFI